LVTDICESSASCALVEVIGVIDQHAQRNHSCGCCRMEKNRWKPKIHRASSRTASCAR
jgi:hypothetical protein